MPPSPPPPATRRTRPRWRLLLWFAALVLIAVAAWSGVLLLARQRLSTIERRWTADPVRARASALPDAAANESSRVVDELESRFDFGDGEPGSDGTPAWSDVEDDLRAWLDAQLFSEGDEIAPTPGAAELWLAAHDVTLEALTLHLLEDEAPRWAWSPRDAPAGRGPPFKLHAVLFAAALERARDGHPSAALALIDASWKLNVDARSCPSRVMQLGADATLRRQAALLAKLPHVPVSWEQRLAEADPREQMSAALRVEPWTYIAMGRKGDREALRTWLMVKGIDIPDLADGMAVPYFLLTLADLASRVDFEIERSLPACVQDEQELTGPAVARAPAWNWLAPDALSGVAWARGVAARTQLDLEFASAVLATRRALAEGREPEALACNACPERQFEVVRTHEGGVLLSLSGGPVSTLRIQARKDLRHGISRSALAAWAGEQ